MSDLVQRTNAAAARQSPVENLIRSQETGLAMALAGRIGADRFIRAAVTAFRTTPHLDECTPQSLLGGLFVSAQLGLEIGGPRGYAYLVPFRTKGVYEAQLVLGYKGLLELAYRSGQLKAVDAFIVRDDDLFVERWDPDRGRIFDWTPGDRKANPVGAVAYVVNTQGGLLWEYLTEEEIHQRRPARWQNTPWSTWPDQMWMKTAMKSLFRRVRLSADDVALAIEADQTVQRRIPGLDDHVVEHVPVQGPERPHDARSGPNPPPDARTPAAAQTAPEPPPDDDAAEEERSRREYAEWLAEHPEEAQ